MSFLCGKIDFTLKTRNNVYKKPSYDIIVGQYVCVVIIVSYNSDLY